MSLIASGEGFLVLDQVNQRVTRWSRDGKAQVQLKLASDQAFDVAVAANGSVAVLDRLVEKQVTLFDRDGRSIGALTLDPAVVGDTGSLTGVFVDGDEVLVEREHGPLIRVGTIQGGPLQDSTEIPGRPSRDGKLLLSAGIVNAKLGSVYIAVVDRATGEARFTRQLNYPGLITSIVALDSDRKGTLYLGVALDQGSASPTLVTCLEPARGNPLGSVALPTNDSPEETGKEITVTDDGRIIFAHRLDDGMAFESYTCP